jgi:hypothetical protein
MKNFLSSLDFMSHSPQLYIKGEKNFRNFFGGILTILLGALTVTAFGYFFSRILRKENPSISFRQVYKTHGIELRIKTSEPNPYEFYMVE